MIDPTVVVPPPELDVVTAGELDERLGRCDPQGTTVLDFADVTFCDSSGLSVLVHHAVRHVEAGGRLQVRAPRPVVRALFEITGVQELIGLDADPAVPAEPEGRAPA